MLEIGAESDANARPAASVRALGAAVEAFVPDLAGSLDQLVADLAEVARLRDRLSLALSRYVGELDAREAAEALGSISTTDWVRHNCRMSGSAASDLLAVGDQLASLPRAEAAVVAGSVGFGHLVHLARTRRHAASHPWGRSLFDEEQLLGQAMEQSVSRFGFTCVHVRHAADAAGMAAEFEEGRQHRRLSIRRAAGGYVLFDGAWMPRVAPPCGPHSRRSRGGAAKATTERSNSERPTRWSRSRPVPSTPATYPGPAGASVPTSR